MKVAVPPVGPTVSLRVGPAARSRSETEITSAIPRTYYVTSSATEPQGRRGGPRRARPPRLCRVGGAGRLARAVHPGPGFNRRGGRRFGFCGPGGQGSSLVQVEGRPAAGASLPPGLRLDPVTSRGSARRRRPVSPATERRNCRSRHRDRGTANLSELDSRAGLGISLRHTGTAGAQAEAPGRRRPGSGACRSHGFRRRRGKLSDS